jgi:hypothetical protein
MGQILKKQKAAPDFRPERPLSPWHAMGELYMRIALDS